jgi:hypothetical protein
MTFYRLLVTAIALLLLCASPRAGVAEDTGPQVYSDAGNIVIERKGVKTRLTSSEMDVDPVLSPSGSVVVYTRQGRGHSVHGYDVSQVCTLEPRPDELRQINADGSGDKLLLKGRKGDPDDQLCDFKSKQFSSDGKRLYFLTPGSDRSGALHVLDMRSGDDHFMITANDLLVLNFCTNKYKDDLVVLQRREFLLGGTYNWYWLFDQTGKKELGPLGEFDNPDDMVRQAHGVWCGTKP